MLERKEGLRVCWGLVRLSCSNDETEVIGGYGLDISLNIY